MVIDRHSCKSYSDARLLLGNLASLMGKEESTRSRSVKPVLAKVLGEVLGPEIDVHFQEKGCFLGYSVQFDVRFQKKGPFLGSWRDSDVHFQEKYRYFGSCQGFDVRVQDMGPFPGN